MAFLRYLARDDSLTCGVFLPLKTLPGAFRWHRRAVPT